MKPESFIGSPMQGLNSPAGWAPDSSVCQPAGSSNHQRHQPASPSPALAAWGDLIAPGLGLLLAWAIAPGPSLGAEPAAPQQPLRIICFGAHPDDCELQAGGVAAMWAARGHKVKFVSMTNGDIGHWREAGGPLALRRKAEVEATARKLGVTVEVLDIHDGELMPTLENRRLVVRLIRQWGADIVMSHRPNDYHPDHRYTAILVQDAAYMVTVPFFCPDVPALKNNPVFLYYPDRFQKPTPFQPDIVVAIDSVIEQKLDALAEIVSQFDEGGANGSPALVSDDPAQRAERRRQVRQNLARRNQALADRFRAQLQQHYGPERAANIRYAEAFELCEYGRQPSPAELKQLFPFFGD
jgi:LmbE family N-acetylglucosaminyl deacetylase